MRAVDLFAGAGGFTCGALAAGLDVVACANHWRAAIDVAVDGGRSRMLSADELRRGMGFPAAYRLPEGKCAAVRMLGNAIPPALAESICRQALEAA